MNRPGSTRNALWATFRPLFARWTGVQLPLSAAASVETLLQRRGQRQGLDASRYLSQLEAGLLPGERPALADALLNHTSWFLREREGLDHLLGALEAQPLPGPKSVWCAGCAGGHEPYSLAMMAESRGLALTIHATDLGPSTLAGARAGRFPISHLRNVPPAWRDRYFETRGDTATVRPALRDVVHFAEHNLATPPHRPVGQAPFDAVVCRNVLIYFQQQTSLDVLRAFAAAAPRGVVLLGAAEQPLVWMTDALEPDARAGGQLLVARRPGSVSRPARAPGRGAPRRRPPAPRPAARGDDAPPVARKVPPRELRDRSRGAARPRRGGPRPSRPRLTAAARRAGDGRAPEHAPDNTTPDTAPTRVRRRLHAEARVRDASLLLRRGDEEEALAVLDEVLEGDPMVAVAHVARGLVLKHRGDLKAAATAFRNARFLTQDGAWMAPYQLGLCLEQLGDLLGAREAYRHALGVLEGGGVSGTAGFGGTDLDDGMAGTIAAACRARLATL